MIKKIRRNTLKNIFINLEKEEEWLNKMCIDGYALKEICDGYYIFNHCNPGEYIYRIEFSDSYNSSEDKSSYLAFIQDMNIELVSSVHRFLYFRRKSSLGEFNIYSDIDSKIKHYKRINIINYMLSLIFILTGLSQDVNIINGIISHNLNIYPIVISLTFIILGLYFLLLALPLQKKVLKLLKQKKIQE